MKEGTSLGGGTLFYGGDSRGRQEVSTAVPEDVGLSLRRVKPPRSRFDVPHPLNPVGMQAPRRWDSEGVCIGRQSAPPPNVAILEDYLLEDEEALQQQKNSRERTKEYDEPEDSRLSQWKSVSDKATKTNPGPPVGSGPPVRPPDPPNIEQGGWHPVASSSGPPPTGFPDPGQPPPGFSGYGQPRSGYGNFFPYDYQSHQQPPPLLPPQQPPPMLSQQPPLPMQPIQYGGYQPTFYQGYSASYNQEWGNQQPPPPGLGTLPDMSLPPPVQSSSTAAPIISPIPTPKTPTPPTPSQPPSNKISTPEPVELQRSDEERESAVRKEQRQQTQELLKQREDYLRKSNVLARELELLQEQKEVLLADTSTDNSRILRENSKLQEEIRNKLKAINNVVGMLSGIMSDKTEWRSDKRKRSKSSSKEPQVSVDTDRKSSKRSSSSTSSEEGEVLRPKEMVNYSFFDPEEHWCQVCNVFPSTAKEYLNHLLSEEHKETITSKKLADLPWHKNNPEKERKHYKGAPNKRTPIKGLQFFISSTAWFCKLCDAWIGDLHCASLHLKSEKHMDNYEDFLAKNKDWEETWSLQRLEAIARSKEEERRMQELARVRKLVDDEDVSKQRLEATIRMREGWGEVITKSPPRVRESLKITVANDEVQDHEDLSRSIRVAMRNKSKAPDPKPVKPMGPALPPTKKSNPFDTSSIPVPPSQNNGSTQGQWAVKSGNTVISEGEKQLLKNLKDKFKQKQDKEDMYKRDERKERKMKDRRFRDRSYERSRSRSRSRGRTRSRSRGREFSRERVYDRERSHSRERRRRRRSSSPRRGHSRSHTPEQRKPIPRKIEPKKWVAPPSSPPPYITRKPDDKEKWDKPKKKAAPIPVASLPKSKYGFIGRMPSMAKKKHSDKSDKSSKTSDSNIATDRRAPEDMEIDSGASDSEQPEMLIEAPVATNTIQEVAAQEEDEEVPAAEVVKTAVPLPQDFQDALSILFPDDMPPTFEGIGPAEITAPVPPSAIPMTQKQACNISQEELLMLGIDPEDMVAQGFFK